jgi:hypothetical protein
MVAALHEGMTLWQLVLLPSLFCIVGYIERKYDTINNDLDLLVSSWLAFPFSLHLCVDLITTTTCRYNVWAIFSLVLQAALQ